MRAVGWPRRERTRPSHIDPNFLRRYSLGMSAALISEVSVGFDHRQDAGADRLVRLRKESRKNSWPLIVDINCDLRYLKHPQLSRQYRVGDFESERDP